MASRIQCQTMPASVRGLPMRNSVGAVQCRRLSTYQSVVIPRGPSSQLRSGLLSNSHGLTIRPHGKTSKAITKHSRVQVVGALAGQAEISAKNLNVILSKTADNLEKDLNGLNVFLVGMMGCGKSTIGRMLSDLLGYGFFDSDTMVEKAVGTTVAAIFQEQGEPAFRELESQAISSLSSMEGLVIATGGGAILRNDNWRNMRNGVTVWIDVPVQDLASRVVSAGIKSRPILSQGPSKVQDEYSQAFNRLCTVFQKREHLYSKADVRISLKDIASKLGLSAVSDLSPDVITLHVIMAVKEFVHARNVELEEKVPVHTGYIYTEQAPFISEQLVNEPTLKEMVSQP